MSDVKLCECGCGQPAPISKQNNRRYNRVKGQPIRFISGHNIHHQPFEKRLWEKIDRSGGPDACWPWTAYRTPLGYGQIRRGKTTPAHRAVWEAVNGPMPPDKEACHKCNNPPCCNPAHIYAGTHTENMHDFLHSGYFPFGERHPQAKLTCAAVLEIRALHAQGITSIELSQRFQVAKATISDVLTRRTWYHV